MPGTAPGMLGSDAAPTWVGWENLGRAMDNVMAGVGVTVARTRHMLVAVSAAARGLAASVHLEARGPRATPPHFSST